MKTPTFKKGQWLISRLKKEHGSTTQLCKLEKAFDDCFRVNRCLFFRRNKLVHLNSNDHFTQRISSDKSLQWRPATKAELKKYSQLIFR